MRRALRTRSIRWHLRRGNSSSIFNAARHFLNAEPTQAVRSALNGKNPVRDFKALSAFVGSDPDASAGLQRAVADYIAQSYVRNPQAGAAVGSIKPDAFATFLNRTTALREVFSPEQMKAMQDVAADLQRTAQPLPKAQSGASSGAPSLLRGYVFGHGAAGLAGVAGYLFGGVHGALEAFGGYEVAKKALDAMTRTGVERTDQLLTEALLNPELARTLLMKATPGNRPFIAQRLSSQLGSLAAVGGASAAGEGQSTKTQRPLTLPAAPRAALPASMISPALAPGGALRGGLLGAMAR